MSTPITDFPKPEYPTPARQDGHDVQDDYDEKERELDNSNSLTINVEAADEAAQDARVSPVARSREEKSRLEDELAILQLERQVSSASQATADDKADPGSIDNNQIRTQSQSQSQGQGQDNGDASSTTKLDPAVSREASRQQSRRLEKEPVDEFDIQTNPLHEKVSKYNPPDNPTTSFARAFKRIHNSSFLVRYLTYIAPVVLLILIPLLVGSLAFPNASVGDVSLKWFSIWLEIFWLTLWAGRIVAKGLPAVAGLLASVFTNNPKKWRDMARQLELHVSLFLWWLGVEISFLPTMTNHHNRGPSSGTRNWETIVNKIIISIFVGFSLNLIEKVIIQLIAISFHLRTYADRIEINKFQIGSLTKLYTHSTHVISMKDRDFEDQPDGSPYDGGGGGGGPGGRSSGTKTPAQYADRAQRAAKETLNKIGDVAGAVAGDFTGREVNKSNHPHQVVLTLLSSPSGSQVLARRLYRTFAREGFDTVFPGDLKSAFDSGDEAEAAFTMFDKDLNGDISMEELETVCVEIGRERKSITASLKDLDSVVSKLDEVFDFVVIVITLIVFLSLISASTAGVLTSAGSSLLALSWLFSATAQEFLASIIFVFVKHPFDVGDRVTIYGNSGTDMTGDDYYVKEIALLYTEFKKLQGHVVQAPNSYLNTLFVLNQRRSGPLAEAIPLIIAYGTTIEQIDALRQQLQEFVRHEKRDFSSTILTELREVTENFSLTLNVVFTYKSNWQNELLRIQRRNKFICNMMLSLQDLGIQGPRHNLAGFHKGLPYHLTHQGAPPQYTETAGDDPHNPAPADPSDPEARDHVEELGGPSSGANHQRRPSILRNRAGTGSSSSRSATARKRVDFSLGLRDIASGDEPMSGVHDDRDTDKVGHVIRNSNREAAEKRRVEREEQRADQQRRTSAEQSLGGSGRARGSADTNRSGMSTSVAGRGPSLSSSGHRNRFLGRLRPGSVAQGQSQGPGPGQGQGGGDVSPISASAPRPSGGSFRGRGFGDESAMEEGRYSYGQGQGYGPGYGPDRDVSPLPNIPRMDSFSGAGNRPGPPPQPQPQPQPAPAAGPPPAPGQAIRNDPSLTTWTSEPVRGGGPAHFMSASRPSQGRDDEMEMETRYP